MVIAVDIALSGSYAEFVVLCVLDGWLLFVDFGCVALAASKADINRRSGTY